jgi:hypothetical protein
MPRTLPAALTTVMDAGIFEPYIRVMYNADPNETLATTVQPLGFKLSALNAEVKIPSTADDTAYFCIVRGALISGTPSTISSIWFRTVTTQDDGRFTTLIGEPLDRSYLSIAANSDYQTVIETALTFASGTIIPSYEGAAGWKAYQFYPTGKNIILSPRKKLFTILQQKYLIFATEDGWDGTDNNMFFFVATDTRATDYSITDPLFTTTDHEETRRLITRDEASVVRSNGSATAIIHNLGFLHSTASLPTNAANGLIGAHTSKVPVHLKYRTGDQITITRPNFTTTRRFKVTEVLDLQSTPAWYMILEPLEWFGSTEGGPLPSTIEAAAPYTPLATGNFDGVLSANDNNLQAAMETIDDHAHEGAWIMIEDINLTGGDQSSFDFQSIPATYKNLKIIISARSTNAGTAIPVKVKFNDDAGNNYIGMIQWDGQTGKTEQATAGAPFQITFITGSTSPANYYDNVELWIPDYANANVYKQYQARGKNIETNSANRFWIYDAIGNYLSTTAISRITLTTSSNFKQYSRATLYGMK